MPGGGDAGTPIHADRTHQHPADRGGQHRLSVDCDFSADEHLCCLGRVSPGRNGGARNGAAAPDRYAGAAPDRNAGANPDRNGRAKPDGYGRANPDRHAGARPDRHAGAMTTLHSRSPHRRTAGQSLAEFAMVVPVLFLLILGIIEAGRFGFYYHSLNHATGEGARYAIVHGENAFDKCPSGPLPPGSTSNDCDPDGNNVRARIAAESFGLSDAGGLTYGWPGDSRFPLYHHNDGSDAFNQPGRNVTVRLDYVYPLLVPLDLLPEITIRTETTLVINN